ncbi:MAG: hypothetical protein RL266_2749 [Bacteroidota bacterium]|jgi:antitoxin component YwqK of YwqJK toxin-antitoxin module
MNTKFNFLFSLILALLSVLFAFGQDMNRTDENGLKQGNWKKLYKNGKVRYEGQFKDDKPVGLFKYYYENGELQATNNHVGDGTVANHVYHKNGKIKAKGIYQGQLKDSLWQYFNENEILVLEETYHSDTLHGYQKTYYENGQLGEETNYHHGIKHGKWLKFFEQGESWVEANYEMGNLHGKFVMYADKNKMQVQGKYHLGIRTGTWLMFNTNGTVRTKEIYRHGSLQETQPQNGEFIEYYDNEIPKSVYNYKNGQKEGEFKEYYNKGEWIQTETPGKMGGPVEVTEQLQGTQLKVKGWYHLDKLNGKVTHYKEDGSVERVEVWEEGVLVSTIDWEAEGNE